MVRTSKWSHFQWLQHSILMFFFLRKMLPDNSQNHGYRWWKIWKNPRRWRLIVTWLATGSYIYIYILYMYVCIYVSCRLFVDQQQLLPNHVCWTFKSCIKHIKHPWAPDFPAFVETKLCNTLPLMMETHVRKTAGTNNFNETLHSMDVWNASFKKLVYFRICPFLQQIHGSVIQGCPNGWFFGKPLWKEEFPLIGQAWITKESRRSEPLFVELR